jgi:kynurenine formamidase
MVNSRSTRVVDLSHRIEHGMTTYPGLPAPEIGDHMSREDSHGRYPAGTEFQIGRITMVANTGTYIDVPFHRYRDGADLASVELAGLVNLPGLCVDVSGADRKIGPEAFAGRDLAGAAVLVRTGWDRHWRTGHYGDAAHPFLSADAVQALVSQRPAVVGIDTVNIDDLADLLRPAHTGLLGAGIPILEHMTGLRSLPAQGFTFHAAPIPVAGMGSFPVRAYAVIPA